MPFTPSPTARRWQFLESFILKPLSLLVLFPRRRQKTRSVSQHGTGVILQLRICSPTAVSCVGVTAPGSASSLCSELHAPRKHHSQRICSFWTPHPYPAWHPGSFSRPGIQKGANVSWLWSTRAHPQVITVAPDKRGAAEAASPCPGRPEYGKTLCGAHGGFLRHKSRSYYQRPLTR